MIKTEITIQFLAKDLTPKLGSLDAFLKTVINGKYEITAVEGHTSCMTSEKYYHITVSVLR